MKGANYIAPFFFFPEPCVSLGESAYLATAAARFGVSTDVTT